MNKKVKQFLSIFVLMIIIALAFYYIYTNYHEFSSLKLENPSFIFFISVLFLVSYVFISIETKYLIKPLKVDLSFIEAYALSIMTGFYNLITPFRGGMAARAIYLKKKHKFSYSDFFASLSASYILMFFVASILGLLSSYLIYQSEGKYNLILIGIFIVVFFGMIFLMVLPDLSSRKFSLSLSNNSIFQKFLKVINGWQVIKHNHFIIIVIIIITLIQILFSSVILYMQFHVFGWEISLSKAILISCIGNLGLLISLTPAGLGINESITIFTALALGISPSQTLPVAILGRLITTVILFILGPISSYYLLKRNSRIDK